MSDNLVRVPFQDTDEGKYFYAYFTDTSKAMVMCGLVGRVRSGLLCPAFNSHPFLLRFFECIGDEGKKYVYAKLQPPNNADPRRKLAYPFALEGMDTFRRTWTDRIRGTHPEIRHALEAALPKGTLLPEVFTRPLRFREYEGGQEEEILVCGASVVHGGVLQLFPKSRSELFGYSVADLTWRSSRNDQRTYIYELTDSTEDRILVTLVP